MITTINFPSALKRNEAAAKISVSPTTFDEWVKKGWMPTGIKPLGEGSNGLRLWDANEIQQYWDKLRENFRDDNEEELNNDNPFDRNIG